MAEQQVLAKGVNFIYARQFFETNYGKDAWERIIKALPDADRAVWTQGLLATSSYPFSAFKAMTAALPAVIGRQTAAELSKVYEFIADQSLNRMYKIFFRLMNPSYVIRNYPVLWSRFFSSGAVEVPVAGKGRAVLRFTLPAVFVDWLPPACLGFSRKAVEMSGGKSVSMRETGKKQQANGDWIIEYELQWNE